MLAWALRCFCLGKDPLRDISFLGCCAGANYKVSAQDVLFTKVKIFANRKNNNETIAAVSTARSWLRDEEL